MSRWQKESKPIYGSGPWLEEVFTYHAPNDAQQMAYHNVREAAKMMAHIIVAHTPYGEDQKEAISMLRQSVMKANAAIALDGLI